MRNRLQDRRRLTNAAATVALRERGGLEKRSCTASGRTMHPAPVTGRVPTTSPESVALAKELKQQGFAFVGPTTMYALMQALGLFDPHVVGCHRRGAYSVGSARRRP